MPEETVTTATAVPAAAPPPAGTPPPPASPVAPEQDEAQQLADFLRERGIDLTDASSALVSRGADGEDDPDGDTGEDPAAGRVSTAGAPPAPAAATPQQPPPAGDDQPGTIGYRLRQTETQLRETQRLAGEYRDYLNVILGAAMGTAPAPAGPGGGAAAQRPAAAPASENPPDLFTEPERALDWHIQRRLAPLQQELAQVRAENEQLRGSDQARGEQEATQRYVAGLARLEETYEATNPGARQRFTDFAGRYQQHLVAQGWQAPEALDTWNREVDAMARAAIARGINPVAFVDGWIRSFGAGGGTAAPAAAAAAAPVDGRMAAAARAQTAGATATVSTTAAEGSAIDELRRNGVTPAQVKEMLSKGDRRGFLAAMKAAERGGQ